MSNLPPYQRKTLLKFAENIDIENKHTLLECYKNRLEYGCTYPEGMEKMIDTIHTLCMKKLAPPWWVDLLD